jgi:hypothetical protein
LNVLSKTIRVERFKVLDRTFGIVVATIDSEIRESLTLFVANNEEIFDAHFICGESTSLITANDCGATKSLNRGEFSDDSSLLGHSSGTKSKACSDNCRETFRDSSDSQGYCYFEVIHGTFNPVSENFITEVRDIHQPANDANIGDIFSELITEFVDFLLKRRIVFFVVLGFLNFILDLADFSEHTSVDNDCNSVAIIHKGSREQVVSL